MKKTPLTIIQIGAILLNSGIKFTISEKQAFDSPTSYTYTSKSGNGTATRRVPKTSFLQVTSRLNLDTVIGFSTWCLPADLETAKAKVEAAIIEEFTKQKEHMDQLQAALDKYLREKPFEYMGHTFVATDRKISHLVMDNFFQQLHMSLRTLQITRDDTPYRHEDFYAAAKLSGQTKPDTFIMDGKIEVLPTDYELMAVTEKTIKILEANP